MAEQTYTPSQMAQAILNIPGGGNPTGTVIYYAGKTAPTGYLACDGTVYNIADYPALAAFMAENYDANNYWGGDGETTFAVPDWQGEFFRAAGTNGHANQGSGAAVGVHQDGTEIPNVSSSATRTFIVAYSDDIDPRSFTRLTNTIDSAIGITSNFCRSSAEQSAAPDGPFFENYTSRPTNTSLLVCIKT